MCLVNDVKTHYHETWYICILLIFLQCTSCISCIFVWYNISVFSFFVLLFSCYSCLCKILSKIEFKEWIYNFKICFPVHFVLKGVSYFYPFCKLLLLFPYLFLVFITSNPGYEQNILTVLALSFRNYSSNGLSLFLQMLPRARYIHEIIVLLKLLVTKIKIYPEFHITPFLGEFAVNWFPWLVYVFLFLWSQWFFMVVQIF